MWERTGRGSWNIPHAASPLLHRGRSSVHCAISPSDIAGALWVRETTQITFQLNMSMNNILVIVLCCAFVIIRGENQSPNESCFGAEHIQERRAQLPTGARHRCFYTEGWNLSTCQCNLDWRLIHSRMTKAQLPDKDKIVLYVTFDHHRSRILIPHCCTWVMTHRSWCIK